MADVKKSRVGLTIYSQNPSIKTAIQGQKTGIKRISNPQGDEMIVSNSATGEIITGVNVGFHQNVKVDKTKFVKLYLQGVTAFAGLTKTAGKVLEMVIAEASTKAERDLIWLSIKEAEEFGIPERTFLRGLKELRQKEILYDCDKGESWYFINVNYIFNGDRLAFLKTYELDTGEVVDVEAMENPNQGLLPFEGEISTEYFEEDTGLIVPFNEAIEFKGIASDFCPGRKWDNERKMWIVQAGTPKEPFAKWL
jgi:hypothetical protein